MCKKGKIPWNKGKKGIYSKETLDKLSESHKRKNLSNESLKNMSNGHKNHIPWNKGLKGVQIHSEETKRKMSEANKGRNLGKHPSEETRQKQSESHKGKKHTEEQKRKISDALMGIKRSKETKQKISDHQKGEKHWNYGKKLSKEHKEKLITSRIGCLPSPKSGRGKGEYYESLLQGKKWLRSSYEIKFAKYLDKYNIPWLYEIKTFDLDDTTYTPDFYLPTCDLFIDTKGYMSKENQEKINKFYDYYNEETLKILYKGDLLKLGIEV